MQVVRTTIRIRKDLLDQSRMLALREGTTLQAVINQILTRGFGHITDFDLHQQSIAKIDQLRSSFRNRKDIKNIVEKNKRELQKRTDQLLNLK